MKQIKIRGSKSLLVKSDKGGKDTFDVIKQINSIESDTLSLGEYLNRIYEVLKIENPFNWLGIDPKNLRIGDIFDLFDFNKSFEELRFEILENPFTLNRLGIDPKYLRIGDIFSCIKVNNKEIIYHHDDEVGELEIDTVTTFKSRRSIAISKTKREIICFDLESKNYFSINLVGKTNRFSDKEVDHIYCFTKILPLNPIKDMVNEDDLPF